MTGVRAMISQDHSQGPPGGFVSPSPPATAGQQLAATDAPIPLAPDEPTSANAAHPGIARGVMLTWLAGLLLAGAISFMLPGGPVADDAGADAAAASGSFMAVAFFLICLVGATFDAAMRHIPNVLTYPAILLGLGVNLLMAPGLSALGLHEASAWLGSPGVRDGALGFVLCAMVGVVSFMARGLGGGDVKILAAAGAMLGFHEIVPVLFNTLLIAAVFGIGSWVLAGLPVAGLQRTALRLLTALGATLGMTRVHRFRRAEAPFAVSLLLGLVLSQFVYLHEPIMRVLLGR